MQFALPSASLILLSSWNLLKKISDNNFQSGQGETHSLVLRNTPGSRVKSLKGGSGETRSTFYWRSGRDKCSALSETIEDNLVIFNKSIIGASYERHGGGKKLVSRLLALAGEI